MSLLFASLLAAMSTTEAIITVLNTANATGPRHYAEARERVAADARDGRIVQRYVYGLVADDKDLARRYLDETRESIRAMAEKRNNSLAWYLLSMETNDLTALKKAAEGGNPQALNALGSIVIEEAVSSKTLDQAGREKILERGFRYFSRAAARKDANAFINLGTCYQRGLGCARDMELAFECFKSAAEMGHPEGMDYMSAAFQFGHGVKADAERSLYWKMRGRSARGDEAAAKWLKERK